jgi:hypothetical protein
MLYITKSQRQAGMHMCMITSFSIGVKSKECKIQQSKSLQISVPHQDSERISHNQLYNWLQISCKDNVDMRVRVYYAHDCFVLITVGSCCN